MANGNPTYTLIVQNNSLNTWSACVYQTKPDTETQDVMSLAWFAQEAAPQTRLQFQWTIDYAFVWSETGELKPGITFTASQTFPADPYGTNNMVTFTQETGGAFTFENQTQGEQSGNLYIQQDGTIPENVASVGIAMSNAGTFAVAAEPNIGATFTPDPNYWITFGTYHQGEVISVEEITNAAAVVFPPNVLSMTATLNADNTWTVVPTPQ